MVTGERKLVHQWKSGKGAKFQCTTLYGALERYCWPETGETLDFPATVKMFQKFRSTFEDIRTIDSNEKQKRFIDTAIPP